MIEPEPNLTTLKPPNPLVMELREAIEAWVQVRVLNAPMLDFQVAHARLDALLLRVEQELQRQAAGLTFEQFSVANLTRCEAPNGFNHKLGSWTLSDWFTAVLGELGEAANITKKLNRVRDGIPGNDESEAELREKLRREMADTLIYLDLAAQAAGFRIGEAVAVTFDAKSAKLGYPVKLAAPCPAPRAAEPEEG